MSEMLEKVARAIKEADGYDPDRGVFSPEGFCPRWRMAIPAAVAAVRALREPTEEMLTIYARESFRPRGGVFLEPDDAILEGFKRDFAKKWVCVIDSILSTPTTRGEVK